MRLDNILVIVSDGGYRAAIRNERGAELFSLSDMLPVDEGSFSGEFTLYFTEASSGVCLWANTATYDGGTLSLFCEVFGKDLKEAVEIAIREVDSRFRETIFALEAIAPPKVPPHLHGQLLREVDFKLDREERSFLATIETENGVRTQEIKILPSDPVPKWRSVAGSIWIGDNLQNACLLRITTFDDEPRAVLPVFAQTLYGAILALEGA